MKEIPVCGIAAHGSDQGKTRLMLALLREFGARGVKVAVMKHGQHIALPPDKDGSLFMEAGATASLVVSPQGWLLVARPEPEPDFDAALALLRANCLADLLLVEGYKHGPQPKLLLTVECLSEAQLLPQTLALVSDTEQTLPLPCFGSAEVGRIAGFIMERFGMGER